MEAAHAAIAALHATKLGGRTVVVKSADQDCEYGERCPSCRQAWGVLSCAAALPTCSARLPRNGLPHHPTPHMRSYAQSVLCLTPFPTPPTHVQPIRAETANSNLYCTNLPLSWTDETLKSTFSQYGNVLSTKMLTALPGMPGKGGLVRMGSVEEVRGPSSRPPRWRRVGTLGPG